MLFTDVRHKVHSSAQSCCKCRFPTYTYCSTTEYFRACYMKICLKHSWLSVVWLCEFANCQLIEVLLL